MIKIFPRSINYLVSDYKRPDLNVKIKMNEYNFIKIIEVPKSFRMNLTKKVHIKYAGCYINTFADVIYTPVGNLTNKLCNQFCRSLNYTFSGTKQL